MIIKEISRADVRPPSLWDKIFWNILPNRCVLCGKWKLFGKRPHRKCEDYELVDEGNHIGGIKCQ